MIVTTHILVHGRVQGIGFRRFICGEADKLGVSGTVQNQSDGDVLTVAVGERKAIEQLITRIESGNGFSIIEKIDVKWKDGGDPSGEFKVVRTLWW